MYQADRFDVKRDLKQVLRDTEGLRECLNAFDASDSKALVQSLFTAIPKVKDKEKRKGAPKLLEDIFKMPDSFRDYRERLKDESCDTSEMKGMGAAESNVDIFSNRLKKGGKVGSL